MGVSIVWMDEDRSILGYIFEAKWTWEELRMAIAQAESYMDDANHPVDFIADTRGIGLIPSDVITNIRQVTVSVPPHRNYGGITVFVGTNILVRNLMNMAGNIYRQLNQYHTFVFVATIEEAHAIIAEHRSRKRSA